jgi:hypothetical protein
MSVAPLHPALTNATVGAAAMASGTLSPEEREEKKNAAIERKRVASRERMRALRAADPEKFRLRQRKWRSDNIERAREHERRSRQKCYWANPEKAREKSAARKRQTYAKNPEKFRARHREKRQENLHQRRIYEREWFYKNRYGITIRGKEEMLAAQGGVCAICDSPDPGNKKGWWHVDHCHTTGAVRSILCSSCNSGLGYAKDSPVILRKMAEYIEAHAAKNGEVVKV